ncbi:MAG TPA: maleylpyruvate isomerase N-terminal domain-containing protein [Dermatophilaceae bacterium]|nr:maleylpyruvate isomerase N-terminal domain-containing protein [Dermatophilaceae bacterium]
MAIVDEVSWGRSLEAFRDAAGWFVTVTARVGDRWEAGGLGSWSVRDLVGHTSRSLLTVEAYLDVPATSVDADTTAAYFRLTAAVVDDPAVEERGRAAGAALGSDPAGAVAEIAERVLRRVGECRGEELLTTAAGGMRLADYLPTRTFELVAHTCDLARAVDAEPDPPAGPAAEALRLVADLAVAGDRAGPLLLAVTGRERLPDGFSVLRLSTPHSERRSERVSGGRTTFPA